MSKAAEVGVVRADEALRVASFCSRMQISPGQVSRMRKAGLKIRRDGQYVTILGADYLEYLRNLPAV